MENGYVITHFMAGQQNFPSQFDNIPSSDSMSHNWRGPGFYSTENKRFIQLQETVADPTLTGRSTSASCSRPPALVPATAPAPPSDPWSRQWRGPGAGFYSPQCHTWSREVPGANINPDARLFFNEEDWLKYKFMCANPTLNLGQTESQNGGSTGSAGGSARKPKSRELNILAGYL